MKLHLAKHIGSFNHAISPTPFSYPLSGGHRQVLENRKYKTPRASVFLLMYGRRLERFYNVVFARRDEVVFRAERFQNVLELDRPQALYYGHCN